jgi:hypothetical protein
MSDVPLSQLTEDELAVAIWETETQTHTATTPRLHDLWMGALLPLLIERDNRDQARRLLEAVWDGHLVGPVRRVWPWRRWVVSCSCGWRSWKTISVAEAEMVAGWHVRCGGDPRKIDRFGNAIEEGGDAA